MPYTSSGSGRVYFAAGGQGEGRPVVFIHGAGGNRLLWGSQVRAVSPAHRVVAVDLPGHGRSDGPGRSTIGAYAEVVAALLDHLGSSAVLVGHSMGGGIALHLTLARPELVAGLVLLGTGGRLRVGPSFLAGLQADFPKAVEAITGAAFAPDAASTSRKRGAGALLAAGVDILLGDFQACDAFDVLARLGEIQVPCLVVCGAEDRMMPLKYSEALVRGIPGARVEVIPLAGHMAMLEQPAAVSQSIVSFVSGL